jgi:hypothetical protein
MHLDAQLYSYGVFFNFVGVLMTESTGSAVYSGSALRMRPEHMIDVGHLFQHSSDWHRVFHGTQIYDNVVKIFAITGSNLVSVNLEAVFARACLPSFGFRVFMM